MAHTLATRPGTWSGTRLPIAYRFVRNDWLPDDIIDNGSGKVRVRFLGVDYTGSFTVNDVCAVATYDTALYNYDNQYKFQAALTAKAYSGGNTLLDFDYDYTANSVNSVYLNNLTVDPVTTHQIEIEVWSPYNPQNDILKNIGTFRFSPDGYGLYFCDISSAINSILNADNDSDLSLSGNQVYRDKNIHCQFYIKYRVVTNGTPLSQTSDSANVKNGVFGSRNIGDHNDGAGNLVVYNDYGTYANSPFSWPIKKAYVEIMYNKPYLIEYLADDNIVAIIDSTSAGVTTGELLTPSTVITTAYRIKLLEANTSIVSTEIIVCDPSYGTTVDTIGGSGGGTTGPVTLFTDVASFTQYKGAVKIELTASSTQITGANTSGSVSITARKGGASGTVVATGSLNLVGTDSDSVNIFFQNYVDHVTITGQRNTGPSDQWSLTGSAVIKTADHLSEVLTVEYIEECDNSVTLVWKNSLGLDETHHFPHSQEWTFNYGEYKAKRATLYAENLDITAWEAIQEANTSGEVVRKPWGVGDFIGKTHERVGQQAYVIDSDGNKKAVIIISQPNTTLTKQKKHSAFVTIEYPETLSA